MVMESNEFELNLFAVAAIYPSFCDDESASLKRII